MDQNKTKISGTWKDSILHGHAELKFASGATFEGNFKEGLMDGFGTWKGAGYVTSKPCICHSRCCAVLLLSKSCLAGARSTLENGRTVTHMETGSSPGPMETSTRANGIGGYVSKFSSFCAMSSACSPVFCDRLRAHCCLTVGLFLQADIFACATNSDHVGQRRFHKPRRHCV